MNEESSLWWKNTSGPSRFFSEISEALAKGERAVALITANDASYMNELRDGIINRVLSPGVKVEYISCDVSEAEGDDFDKFIAEQTAPEDSALKRANESAAQFICRNHCMENKILWLYGVKDAETGRKVSAFLKEFAEKCGSSSGKVIAEGNLTVSGKTVKTFVADEYLDEVDVESFSINLYRKKNPKEIYIVYKYMSALMSAAYKKNAARAENFINETQDFLNADLIKIFTEETGDKKSSERIVHKAQQQVFNPLLEEFKLILAEKYEEYFNEAIATTNIKADYPKDDIKDAYDLQIGHMNYITKKRLRLSKPISAVDTNIIENVLYKARNKLAHIVPLTPEEVKDLCNLVRNFQ